MKRLMAAASYWFRCKFETKLLLSIEYDVIDQSNVAEIDCDHYQSLCHLQFFNTLQRIPIHHGDIIDFCHRLGRNAVFDHLSQIRRHFVHLF